MQIIKQIVNTIVNQINSVKIPLIVCCRFVFSIVHNVLGLGEVGDLEAQMFKLALMLIEVQKLNSALLPPFCQTPVMP